MVDRVIVYDGALPQATDILNTNKFGLISESYQNRSILGTSTVVAGLACTPTSPTADLHVNVGVGTIYQNDPTDTAAYGDLGTDTNSIVKQGILQTAVQLTITPPGTIGFSQVYLVQAILNDVDAGTVVLSYYNSANPSSPFSGPANSGTSNLTTRTCPCVIALKAGVAATTGTQSTPAADAGFVGLYAITVANGQTQITGGNIIQLASAPFFPTLPAVPAGVQGGNWVYVGTDTGTANNYVISFGANQYSPTAYTAGMGIKFKAANACSGASVININGIGNANIRRASGIAVATGDIASGQIVELTYDGTNFQMCNYIGSGSITNTNTSVNIPYIADTGALNAIIATFSPAITGGQQVAGLTVEVKLANTITGACTINVNGLGVKSVTLGDLTNPPFNVFVAGLVLLLIYDGTQYQIAGTSKSMFYKQPTSNYTIFVNTSTGSDTLYDGTAANIGSGTSGPLKTIGKAMLVAFGYAPSQFTITISVAAGTYNEAVTTPNYAGPNVIINGAGSGSTIVNVTGAQYAFQVQGPNTITVQNIGATGGAASFVASTSGSQMTTNNTANGAYTNGSNTNVFFAIFGGEITVGNHTFNAGAGGLYAAENNGTVTFNTPTHTISTSISVVFGTAIAESGGDIYLGNPPTFVNPSFVSGPKYFASLNGVILATGLGVNFLPGTVAGSVQTGGQYSA